MYHIIRRAPRTCKMYQILRYDWLPERTRWRCRTRRRLHSVSRQGFSPWSRQVHQSHITSFIDQACSVKMAVYWPPSFFACLCTLTSSKLQGLVQVAVITYPRSANNAADIHSNYAHFTYVTLITYFKCEHLKKQSSLWSF